MRETPCLNKTLYSTILRNLFWVLLLLLPFSIGIDFNGHQIEIPNEPLLIITSIVGFFYAYQTQAWNFVFFKHPLFLASIVYVGWASICTLFSNHFYVSAKYTLVDLVHWWVYFCLMGIVFNKLKNEYSKAWLLYTLSFVVVLILAWYKHAQYGFSLDTSVLVARPFYFDHALYSCTALLLLGFSLPHWWYEKAPFKYFFRIASLFLLIGVYLSFSRAAWLSMMGALVLTSYIACVKPSFRHFFFLLSTLIGISMLVFFLLISKNESQVLSKQGNSWQHLQSTLNVSTDVSNLERLNRYSCAWRMFKTKPIVGYGPGNFIIDYYSFQLDNEMTRLSVDHHQRHRPGKGGGAHSEYLQALSEKGLMGFLAWLVLVLVMIWSVVNINIEATSTNIRFMALGFLFGLLTFFIHSLFNGFFHHEKIAALVWMAMAGIINLNQYSSAN